MRAEGRELKSARQAVAIPLLLARSCPRPLSRVRAGSIAKAGLACMGLFRRGQLAPKGPCQNGEQYSCLVHNVLALGCNSSCCVRARHPRQVSSGRSIEAEYGYVVVARVLTREVEKQRFSALQRHVEHGCPLIKRIHRMDIKR